MNVLLNYKLGVFTKKRGLGPHFPAGAMPHLTVARAQAMLPHGTATTVTRSPRNTRRRDEAPDAPAAARRDDSRLHSLASPGGSRRNRGKRVRSITPRTGSSGAFAKEFATHPKEEPTLSTTDGTYIKPSCPSGGHGRGHRLAIQNRAAARNVPLTVNSPHRRHLGSCDSAR